MLTVFTIYMHSLLHQITLNHTQLKRHTYPAKDFKRSHPIQKNRF